MAHVIGTSGAWKQVVQSLAESGMSFSHPQQLKPALDEMKGTYDQRVTQFRVQVDDEIAALEGQLQKLIKDTQSRVQAESSLVAVQTERLDVRLAELNAERGFFRRLQNYFRITSKQRRRNTLQAELSRFVESEQEPVIDLQRQVRYMVNNKSRIVEQRKRNLDLTIERLGRILTSSELAGAQAEVEVAEILSKLPPECWVFHNVRLEADHFMRFEGVPLESAQVDHVVLAPAGVFVIEVKNWSQGFVEGQGYFDPYTQAGRARFLCQVLLRERGYDTKVRSIIATRGKLPGKRDDQYVKVLQPRELPGYITWFKDPPMTARQINGIRDESRDMVA